MTLMREVVGRERELAAIARFLDAGPRPAVLVLQGEAGIGKTTLWNAGVERALAAGARVLTARPGQAETALAFTALADVLAGALDDIVDKLPQPRRRALRVALLLEESGAQPADGRAVAAGLLSALQALATSTPTVLAIDDVQWLDAASESAVRFAVRRLADAPIAVLLAQRIEGDRFLPLDLEHAPVPVERLEVGPLSAGGIHRIVAEHLDTSLSRPVLRRVHDASGGNPFFALEIARTVDADGAEPVRIPASLQEVVRRRLEALPPTAMALLPLLAALPQATITKVRLVAGAESEAVIEAAIDAGVLQRDGERIRFSHPLLASAAYARPTATERRALHRRLADAAEDPVERGHHLALATATVDAEVADELERTIPRARRRGASQEAADLAAHARRLTPADDVAAARRRAAVEADCLRLVGDTGRAREILDEALRDCPPGAQRARLLFERGQVESWGVDWGRARELFHEARTELGGADEALLAEIELRLAQVFLIIDDDPAPIGEHAANAARLAKRLGDRSMLAEALAQIGLAEVLLGRDARASMESALALEPEQAVLSAINRPSDHLANVWWWRDEPLRALAGLRVIARDAEDRGEETGLLWTLGRVALLASVTGSTGEAAEAADRARDLAAQLAQPENEAVTLGIVAFAAAHRGEESAVRRAAADAQARRRTPGGGRIDRHVRSALGLLALSLGDAREAHDALGPLVARSREVGICEPGALPFVPDDVEALLGLAELAAAEALLDWYAALAERHDRWSARAAAARCRGLLQSARGDANAGVAALEEAVALHDGLPYPLACARTLLALGTAQRRARRRRAARATLHAAAVAFEDLGARLWAERARGEQARIAGRAPGDEGLTSSERRVAELAAEGLSNREIAGALFLSAKTVEFHLRNVFRKLGITSRTQLARRL